MTEKGAAGSRQPVRFVSRSPQLTDVPISQLSDTVRVIRNSSENSLGERADVAVSSGQNVLPLHQFVVKVHQRCNLACDYCYMYEMADQSWRDRIVKMTPETFVQLSRRIGEHASEHQLPLVEFVFHGGEPLLRGQAFFSWAAEQLHADLKGIELRLRVQTNATRLDRKMLETLRRHRIDVGVSLDGDRAGNDRHRRNPAGHSSFEDVVRGLLLLTSERYRSNFRGLYCTIDVRNPPLETYEFLRSFEPPMIDFLLPHGNWDAPPPFVLSTSDESGRYADWLIAIFDRWYDVPGQRLRIRLFDDIISGLLGGTSSTECIGISPVRFVCVDTDGAIGQVDTLKSAYAGAADTGLDIFRNSFDDAMDHPDIRARQRGLDGLSSTCRRCTLASVCGGGYYPHRYRSASGFDNPSVYCSELESLIEHIRRRVSVDVAALKVPSIAAPTAPISRD